MIVNLISVECMVRWPSGLRRQTKVNVKSRASGISTLFDYVIWSERENAVGNVLPKRRGSVFRAISLDPSCQHHRPEPLPRVAFF